MLYWPLARAQAQAQAQDRTAKLPKVILFHFHPSVSRPDWSARFNGWIMDVHWRLSSHASVHTTVYCSLQIVHDIPAILCKPIAASTDLNPARYSSTINILTVIRCGELPAQP